MLPPSLPVAEEIALDWDIRRSAFFSNSASSASVDDPPVADSDASPVADSDAPPVADVSSFAGTAGAASSPSSSSSEEPVAEGSTDFFSASSLLHLNLLKRAVWCPSHRLVLLHLHPRCCQQRPLELMIQLPSGDFLVSLCSESFSAHLLRTRITFSMELRIFAMKASCFLPCADFIPCNFLLIPAACFRYLAKSISGWETLDMSSKLSSSAWPLSPRAFTSISTSRKAFSIGGSGAASVALFSFVIFAAALSDCVSSSSKSSSEASPPSLPPVALGSTFSPFSHLLPGHLVLPQRAILSSPRHWQLLRYR